MSMNVIRRLVEFASEPGSLGVGKKPRTSAYEAALDSTQDMVTRTFGPGASFSVDPAYSGSGFVARAWNKVGYLAYSDETARPNRLAAVKDLRRALHRILPVLQ